MRAKNCIFTITLSIRFGCLLLKLIKSKLEAVRETDKNLRCYEPLSELPSTASFIRNTEENVKYVNYNRQGKR